MKLAAALLALVASTGCATGAKGTTAAQRTAGLASTLQWDLDHSRKDLERASSYVASARDREQAMLLAGEIEAAKERVEQASDLAQNLGDQPEALTALAVGEVAEVRDLSLQLLEASVGLSWERR